MAGLKQTLSEIMANSRTRVIIIVSVILVIAAIVTGYIVYDNSIPGPDSSAALHGAPDIRAVPGGFDNTSTEEYIKLQEKQNVSQAEVAETAGSSAIPTITSSSPFGPNQQLCPCVPDQNGGLSFSSLKNLQDNGLPINLKNMGGVGIVYADGTIRDANGKIIAKVGSDGLIRDANGNILNNLGSQTGKLVYDANGNLIGTVGADGLVRDAKGNVIGQAGPAGVVRDKNGKIIGKTSATVATGAKVYDANGNLLGTVGADGLVRDANGKVIGKVGADGIVRDLNGNIIGKVNNDVGKPVYDANGKLLGYVGADGLVRDATGKVIGKVDANGDVRDSNGNIIGKVSTEAATGSQVYDANGNPIGNIGADGLVRDAKGNIIGQLGTDGLVRDATGKILSRVGNNTPPSKPANPTGKPIYDASGKLIGYVGADGLVHDATGKIIGKMDANGVVRDVKGNIIGATSAALAASSIAKPGAAAITGKPGNDVPGAELTSIDQTLPPGTNPGATSAIPGSSFNNPNVADPATVQATLQRQAAMLADQRAQQLTQQMQTAMSTQATQLFNSWAAPTQQYIVGVADNKNRNASGSAGSGGYGPNSANAAAFIKAGTIMFAILDTAVNSDEPGPIMATVVEGSLKGAKLLGSITNQGQKVLLNFNLLSIQNMGTTVPINAVAIDPDTARTALSSDTDNHYLLRYGTLFASSFLAGYGQAVSQSGATVVQTTTGSNTVYPSLDAKSKMLVALGNVGTRYSGVLGNIFNTPPTVKVYAGVGIGILFTADVNNRSTSNTPTNGAINTAGVASTQPANNPATS